MASNQCGLRMVSDKEWYQQKAFVTTRFGRLVRSWLYSKDDPTVHGITPETEKPADQTAVHWQIQEFYGQKNIKKQHEQRNSNNMQPCFHGCSIKVLERAQLTTKKRTPVQMSAKNL